MIRGKGKQGPAAHGIVGDEDGYGCLMADQRVRNLLGGEDEPARRVQDDIDRGIGRGQADGPEDLLRVFDIDIAGKRESKERERFLPVDEGDEARATFLFKRSDEVAASSLNSHP